MLFLNPCCLPDPLGKRRTVFYIVIPLIIVTILVFIIRNE